MNTFLISIALLLGITSCNSASQKNNQTENTVSYEKMGSDTLVNFENETEIYSENNCSAGNSSTIRILNQEDSFIYDENTLNYSLADLRNKTKFTQLIKFMFNDKKNNDKKINFILLKHIGKTTKPGSNKMTKKQLLNIFPRII